ncbi:MAG: ATP-dependent DNA helicase [Lachnospiraceae bacterium]|nr:ATP-dependent DNA helicase [Lachnospiraceae bacterium]
MYTCKISVRNLVEFILRSGDLTTSSGGLRDTDAMQEGTRIHKKLQRKMGASYQAEVPLRHTTTIEQEDITFQITVEGRADGIFPKESEITIDEIKGVYHDIFALTEPIQVHRAQALCYAYIYATDHSLDQIGVRITYCYIPTEEVRYFQEEIDYETLSDWYQELINRYAQWISWQLHWQETRNTSIHALDFPFPYRDGQADLVKGVYQSIIRGKRLFIEAPTGVGKTIATLYPAIKSIGESLTEKIFYLTAKTITRTVAEETLSLLGEHGMQLKAVTITAKEKICILDKPRCNPATCPRAKGHFDRVNDAVFDLLNHENLISREIFEEYAAKHEVCPFEMCLDTATWTDAVIGDYNYAFDPTSSLKRFFATDAHNDYTFLIDEAHNLVDRGREMYSTHLIKEDFLTIKKEAKKYSKKLTNALENCNRALLSLKRECNEILKCSPAMIDPLLIKLLHLSTTFDVFLQEGNTPERTIPQDAMDNLLNFYFTIRDFLNIYELLDEKYMIYADYGEQGEFRLHLQCMDPSTNLDLCLNKGRAAIFFSATLLPVKYYMEQLAGREDDYAVYAPSPFPTENRLLMIGQNVSTKYTRRSLAEYQRIAEYIVHFVEAKIGNYLLFFPSYRMMEEIQACLETALAERSEINPDLAKYCLFPQGNSMSEQAREEFLSHFQDTDHQTAIGLCVLGGIFGEGIDLTDSQLIGAVIIGTGLPMVCTENELFREFFDQQEKNGFTYAYQYPGMNKVLQAAGRVIRTDTDRGAILLLDERFLQSSYQQLFPREWFPHYVVNLSSMDVELQKFWEENIE